MPPTVESGRPRRRAICGPVSRSPAQRSIAATCSGGSRRWRAGAELRSLSAGSPPARHRASHLRTVRSLTPKSAATRLLAASVEHAADQQESTMRRRARILVDVHPGLRLGR